MRIVRSASAGTMESSDAYVEIEPGTNGIDIQLDSVVKAQYGDSIEATIQEVLKENQVDSAVIRVVDRGALDCVIRARVEMAVVRGRENV